jgi:hypothetical protein
MASRSGSKKKTAYEQLGQRGVVRIGSRGAQDYGGHDGKVNLKMVEW